MKRIQDQEKGPREKKVEPKPAAPVAPTQVKAAVQPVRRPAARQVSEDDEIARIKRENKAAGSSTEAPVPILKKTTPSTDDSATDVSQVPPEINLAAACLPSVYDPFVCCLFLTRAVFLDVTDESIRSNTNSNGPNEQRKFDGEFKRSFANPKAG